MRRRRNVLQLRGLHLCQNVKCSHPVASGTEAGQEQVPGDHSGLHASGSHHVVEDLGTSFQGSALTLQLVVLYSRTFSCCACLL